MCMGFSWTLRLFIENFVDFTEETKLEIHVHVGLTCKEEGDNHVHVCDSLLNIFN